MAFDGDPTMTTKARSIGRATLLRAAITSAERLLTEGIEDALDAGRPDIADKLQSALAHIERGHARANEATPLVAAHFGESDVRLWSGPEDKPPQDAPTVP